MTTPTDIRPPFDYSTWDEDVRDTFLERLCIWSDGGEIAEKDRRTATREARDEMMRRATSE
jgi:hypothetical protein